MREFLNRRDAYVLGRDCRAFPPTSLAQCHTEAQQTRASSASTGSQWPAVTSPGNRGNKQVRGPWRTPDALRTPPDRAGYRAAGSLPYQSLVLDRRRRAGQPALTDASRRPAGYAAAERPAARQQGVDGAELNMSMNRALSEDQSASKLVTFSSSTPDVDQHLTSAAAAVNSAPLTAADQPVGQPPQTTTSIIHHDPPTMSRVQPKSVILSTPSSSDDRPRQTHLAARTVTTTSGPLTSTPLDHSAPASQ